ncbi:hypothetical protein EJ02DRAFT_512628 [Clathrospora elynae]|uniref:C2H2-type domain-containing protein n=1 Tax=Clathrospora elynae TaxID=706981 RepID=A0A6A5SN88_9PLEO|nr:hypothetical protein EJ02DRAFT_512628 [Clathrospora elynae]
MSEPSETGGLLLASSIKQPEGNNNHQPTPVSAKNRKISQSSNDQRDGTKTTSPRCRPGISKQAPSVPHAGPSSPEQRSTTSPTNMASHLSSVHYTRTGRISKAKKGRKVHDCEHCGRSYTRAEHLRRHQRNHAQDDALVCEFPNCGKPFYRIDLLHRHQERHNEPGKGSPEQSAFSPEGSPETPPTSMHDLVQMSMVATTLTPAPSYYQTQPASPLHESVALPSQPKHHGAYAVHHPIAATVQIDAMTPGLSWNEPYSQSPGYSSSSGYGSPIRGPGDYPNIYANGPYHRTRTSSNASFIDQPWSYQSRSPVSTTSTMAYTWPSSDKGPTAPGLAYVGTTPYPMTNMSIPADMDPMASYGQYDPMTTMQRDEGEGVILFGDQQYGMGSIAHTYPFEQYLDYYWRLFHPTFPVVHRSTFRSMNSSPMLHAAMIAVGGQYSDDTSVKRKSRILHDRCIKLLERRDQETMAEPDRLCDFQAIFLIEVLSQYRARRAAKVLSSRFDKVYHRAVENFQHVTSQIHDLASLVKLENATMERWIHWIDFATWQRLLLSCHVLEFQQPLLLAREPLPSLIQDTGFDLPFPGHTSLWDAKSPTEWALAAQQHLHSPRYVHEVNSNSAMIFFDTFQSSVLLAAHYNCHETSSPYISSPSVLDIEHLFDTSPVTARMLLTAKLVQVTPLRALLAVAGETWILSEKVASAQVFTALKITLRTWLAQLWSTTIESQGVPVKEALRLSVDILQQALKEQRDSVTLEIGTDIGIYFAALVLWAITTAATTRVKRPQTKAQHCRPSQSPPVFASTTWAPMQSTPTLTLNDLPKVSTAPKVMQPSTFTPTHSNPASPTAQPSLATTPLLSHAQITINTISFLSTTLYDFNNAASTRQSPADLSGHQTGCISLLLWVKLRLRGVPLENLDSAADAWACKPGEGLGELLDGVTGSLERILNRGWGGWGV